MKKIIVPVNEPLLKGNEKKYLLECLKSNYISSSGKYVAKFENKFSKFVNRKYAVTVSNGTAALQICYAAIRHGT